MLQQSTHSVIWRIGVSVITAILLTTTVGIASASNLAQTDTHRIVVTGEGQVRQAPDMATITLGATITDPNARTAIDEVNRRTNAVIAAVRAVGIEPQDIQTTRISLQEQRGGGPPPSGDQIVGYRASNTVSVTVRDFANVGPVIDASLAAGANSLSNLQYGLQNPDEARKAALAVAVANGTGKAQAIATAMGVGITDLVSVTEGGATPPQPAAIPTAAFNAAGSASTPVEAGELVVRAQVTMVFQY
jgi:uncharacterized protein